MAGTQRIWDPTDDKSGFELGIKLDYGCLCFVNLGLDSILFEHIRPRYFHLLHFADFQDFQSLSFSSLSTALSFHLPQPKGYFSYFVIMMNGGRGGRPRSRERNPARRPNTRTEVEDFKKPDFPSLKGAPSTKRQYTYGAAEEPRRLSVDGMPATLQDAMNGVLRRQERQEAEEAADLQRHGQYLKPQVTRRQNPAREADESESGSDAGSNQPSRGRDNSKYRQGLKSAMAKLGTSLLRCTLFEKQYDANDFCSKTKQHSESSL